MTEPRTIFAAIALVALFNGLFSPLVAVAWKLMPLLFPILVAAPTPLVFVSSSIALALVTLVLSGLPAAIYERATGERASPISMGIWLMAAIFLSLPAFSVLRS